jgi:4-amino-4-deoxy-L-arabinose transferase-like glycosyltransferase
MQIVYTLDVGKNLLNFNEWRIRLNFLPSWFASWCLYLVLVWGFALIRKNYLWITGDDPNLITQAALTRIGQKPNLDFESGYPGLSQFIQADIMRVFGTNVFSQHLYTALLASITGLLVCINFSRIPQWLLSLGLVLIYCQQHLVNPTPNPGHLLEIFLLAIFTLINMKMKRRSKLFFYGSFVLMGLAFLSKQYAVFVLFGYAISQFENTNWRISDRKKYIILLCAGVIAASCYYFLLIPSGTLKLQAATSLLVMVLPFIILTWTNYRSQAPNQMQNFSSAVRNLTAGTIVFSLTVTIGLAVLYKSIQLPHIFYQVLIEVPRKINSNTVLLSLTLSSLLSVLAFLCFAICTIYLVNSQYSREKKQTRRFICQLLAILVGLIAFSKIGNLSGTFFLFIFPIAIIFFYFTKIGAMSSNRRLFFYVLTCYQFVLIPYPNVNFHIMIFVVAFFILVLDKYEMMTPAKLLHLWAFPIALVSLLLVHEVRTIDAMKTYSFQKVEFKSSASSWDLAIVEARNANGDLSGCTTYACKMLILISSKYPGG